MTRQKHLAKLKKAQEILARCKADAAKAEKLLKSIPLDDFSGGWRAMLDDAQGHAAETWLMAREAEYLTAQTKRKTEPKPYEPVFPKPWWGGTYGTGLFDDCLKNDAINK